MLVGVVGCGTRLLTSYLFTQATNEVVLVTVAESNWRATPDSFR